MPGAAPDVSVGPDIRLNGHDAGAGGVPSGTGGAPRTPIEELRRRARIRPAAAGGPPVTDPRDASSR